MKIGLLVIATNKYISFLNDLLSSADEYFLPDQNVEYFVFTDQKAIGIESKRKINLVKTEHKPWPWMTLGRYEIFSSNAEYFAGTDYLFYCDADMKFCNTVGTEILSDRVATQHPGYYGTRGTPEINPESLACVFPFEQMQYFAGGFNGGTKTEYLKMAQKLSDNIRLDYNKNIIAVWHDESHMNRYFIDNPPTTILSPNYCTPSNQINKSTKLSAIVKKHEQYRS